MRVCKGITAKGLPCKLKCERGYCRYHTNQARSIEFYPPSVFGETPSADQVLDGVCKVANSWELKTRLTRVIISRNYDISTAFEMRLSFFRTVEFLKLNREIVFENPEWDKIVNAAISKMSTQTIDNFPLDDYIEDFKRKCDKSYRVEARKKFYWFYLQRVDGLCFDVLERIGQLI